jgi:hypothetical protein
MRTLSQRIIGACRLEAGAYEEVEADRSGTPQAALVVVLTSLAAGIGGMGAAGAPHVNLLTGTIGALAGWVSWAALTYLIGTHVLPEPETKADLGELLRTLAFASSPGLLRILGALPGLGAVVFAVSSLWMLAAMVVAVRQALDYRSTARAVGVCVLGWLLSLAVAAVIGLAFAPSVS